MKRHLIIVLVLSMVCCCLLITGCGGGNDSGKNASTVPDATEDWKTGDITAEQLGVPIYPGAQMDPEQSGALSGKDAGDEGEWLRGVFYSDTAPGDIKAWYTEQLSGKEGFTDVSMSSEKGETGMLTYTSGETVYQVIIKTSTNSEKGNSMIEITSMTGTVDFEKGKQF